MHKLLLAGSLLFVGSSLAAEPAPPPPAAPAPAPALAAFEVVAGKWDCAGKGTMPDATTFPLAGTYVIKRVAAGFGYTIEYTGKPVKGGPPPYQASEVVHWDAAEKKLVRRTVDSFGGASTLASPGEENGEWVFSGTFDMPGAGKMENRDHFQKPAGGSARLRSEVRPPNGTWITVADMVCKKKK